MEDNLIKVLLKSECPHCQGEIFVEVESPTPIIKGVLSLADIKAAKDYVITKLKDAYTKKEIDKLSLDGAIEWIESKETVFGPRDVESVINSVKN